MIKEKLSELWGNIKYYCKPLTRWLSYFKVCRNIYDFDFSGVIEVERHQLRRLRNDIIHYHHHVDWELDVARINLALKLIEIISEDCMADYSFDTKTHKCRVYVNTRNCDRYMRGFGERLEKSDENHREVLKGYLYVEKAWHLYHKLRIQYMRDWWD